MCTKHGTKEAIQKYAEAPVKEQAYSIMDMILSEHTYNDLSLKVRRMFAIWSKCGKDDGRFIHGKWETYPIKCKHPVCPRCNQWLKKKAARLAAKNFRKATGKKANRTNSSYITINGAKLILGSDYKFDLDKMKNQIRYRFTKKLNGIIFIGEFEIAVQYDEETGQVLGKLHVHGWCFHPNETANQVVAELKKAFPSHKAVHLGHPHEDKDLFENIETGSEYACDIDLDVDTDAFGDMTPTVLLNLLTSIETIRSRGRMGIRFEVGVRKAIKAHKLRIQRLRLRLLTHRFNHVLLQLPCIQRELVQSTVGADPPVEMRPPTGSYSINQKGNHQPKPQIFDQKTDRTISAGLLQFRQRQKARCHLEEMAA